MKKKFLYVGRLFFCVLSFISLAFLPVFLIGNHLAIVYSIENRTLPGITASWYIELGLAILFFLSLWVFKKSCRINIKKPLTTKVVRWIIMESAIFIISQIVATDNIISMLYYLEKTLVFHLPVSVAIQTMCHLLTGVSIVSFLKRHTILIEADEKSSTWNKKKTFIHPACKLFLKSKFN